MKDRRQRLTKQLLNVWGSGNFYNFGIDIFFYFSSADQMISALYKFHYHYYHYIYYLSLFY